MTKIDHVLKDVEKLIGKVSTSEALNAMAGIEDGQYESPAERHEWLTQIAAFGLSRLMTEDEDDEDENEE